MTRPSHAAAADIDQPGAPPAAGADASGERALAALPAPHPLGLDGGERPPQIELPARAPSCGDAGLDGVSERRDQTRSALTADHRPAGAEAADLCRRHARRRPAATGPTAGSDANHRSKSLKIAPGSHQ